MRIALNTYTMYGAWFTLRLLEEGHRVDILLSEPDYANILKGIVPKPTIIPRGSKGWPSYKGFDLSIFDLTGREKLAEYSKSIVPTIGDGMFNHQAEDDRMFGLSVMEEAGIMVPPYERFTELGAAKKFISKSKKRFVYKPDGGQDNDTDTTYVSSSADDMLATIDKLFAKTKGSPFVLQEFIKGTEIAVEGWFNGEDFYLLNGTIEEKKFMNNNHGPNTGCAGNLLFLVKESSELYKQGLGKLRDFLRSVGYQGMLDLNTIAVDEGLYGLEFTPRFGYDSSATLFNMYGGNLGEMFYKVATRQVPDQSWKGEFGFGVRVSIPPYPSEIKGKHPEGIPIKGVEHEEYLSTYMYDTMLDKDNLVSAGHSGFLLVPLTYGDTIEDAWELQERRLKNIKIPNMQLRSDIKNSTTKRYNELLVMGLL